MKGGNMTTAQNLRMREPALAMLMGALPILAQGQGQGVGFGNDGYGYGYSLYDPSLNVGHWPQQANYPHESFHLGTHPYEPWRYYQQPYAPPPPYVAPPPPPPPAYDDYYGYGAAPEGPSAPPMAPPPQAAMVPAGVHHGMHHGHPRHWALQNPASTESRSLLLDPNRDSMVKVERYSFSFSPTTNLTLGLASNIVPFTQQPSTSIKGQRVVMNAPCPGFVLVSTLQVANVNVLVGGTEDAYTYSAGAQGVMLDLPRLDPQNRATASGAYTGVLPVGYTQNASFQFIITLQGPSTLAGGYGQ